MSTRNVLGFRVERALPLLRISTETPHQDRRTKTLDHPRLRALPPAQNP